MLGYLAALLGAEIGGEILLHRWAKTGERGFLAAGIVAYVCLAVVFAFSMRDNTLTAMNTAWQCANVTIMAAFGLLVLKEKVSHAQLAGVGLACVAMVLMTM